MTDRYVGPGGDNANSGLTWALRKLTLNGVEDTPVVAGDTVYVGPGTYRETLTVDVSGSSGSIITYIGDNLGLNTDGVGGEVRITGSDDDKTETRTKCINFPAARDYRTFRGFRLDMASVACIDSSQVGSSELVFEDLVFTGTKTRYGMGMFFWPGSGDVITIRRCFFSCHGEGIGLDRTFTQTSVSGLLIENCIFNMANGEHNYFSGIYADYVYGFTVRNCSFYNVGQSTGTSLGVDQVDAVNKTYFYNNFSVNSKVLGSTDNIVDDHTYAVALSTSAGMWFNITKGANSVTHNMLMQVPLLLDGFRLPFNLMGFSAESLIANYGCANSPPSEDFYGITRPVTDSKKTRGAIQFHTVARETTIVPSGETESVKMKDAMTHQIIVPITGKSMTFSVEVYREADYAGTNPQMIIRQPGQSARTETDVGSASTWNTLSDTFTPASYPTWVVLEIRSNNTATSGDYDVFCGDFDVK